MSIVLTYDGLNAIPAGNNVHPARAFQSAPTRAVFSFCCAMVPSGSSAKTLTQRKGSVGTAGYPADIVTNTLGRLCCRNDGLVIGEF